MRADEPPHLTVGGERAPLPRMRSSPRPQPLWCVCLCHLSARAAMLLRWARQAWAFAGSRPWGGGGPSVASFPSPLRRGLVGGLARGAHAGPRGGGGGSPHESLEYWCAPRPRHVLAGQPRAPWCVSWCARHADTLRVAMVQQCLTPLCVSAHVGHGGFPCRSQT